MPLTRYFPRIATRIHALPLAARIAGSSAIVTTALATRLVLADYLPLGVPFLLFFGSVLVSSSIFGRAGGLFSVGLAASYTAWFLMPPVGSFAISDPRQAVGMGLFLTIASAMALTISWLHEAIADLQSSEAHRTALLREFRHRTRNDIAGIAAHLMLRARALTHPDCREAVRRGADHAMAVARIHTHLARATPGTQDGAVVRADEFLAGLCDDLATVHLARRPIDLTIGAEPHVISTERAVTLGMILTEWLADAARHAFPPGRGGRIDVRFVREGDEYVLVVEDDGPPRMANPDPADLGAAFNARMLGGLAKQLKGSFARHFAAAGHGTRCDLRFPVAAPAPLHASPH